MGSIYYYGQDGMIVSDELIKIFDLSTKEIRYSDILGKNVFDFVGFIFRGKNTLAVFPKKFYSQTQIDLLNDTHIEQYDDISLLFNVIQTYRIKQRTSATARSYMGAKDGYDSDYPFKAFYEIYDYYQKYGLYQEKQDLVVKNSHGKIAWKETIARSNKIISEGNLLFYPLYAKKKNYRYVFLTECMAFIIDYTIDCFHNFFNMKKTGIKTKFDFFNNIDYVLLQLRISMNSVFKDINKRLVKSMIEFFEQYREKSKGGNVHVKIRYFDMIWQNMVEVYINKHFSGIDPVSGAAIFDPNLQRSVVTFSHKSFDDIDASPHSFKIDIDHFAYHGNTLYIFDSKYYFEISDLNYKQFAYNELLRYHYIGMSEIHNILFLPGENHSELHFEFGPNYIGTRNLGNKIIEQYLQPRVIMNDYLL